MRIKSEYLIHWTGKDICKTESPLCDVARGKYIERLVNTTKTGLWMMDSPETIVGAGGSCFYTSPVCTCFTENRIAYYKTHANKYGLMGFGFKRDWVADKDGMPVIYFRSNHNDIQSQLLAGYAERLKQLDQGIYRGISLILDYAKPMSNPNTNDYEYIDEAEWRICWNSTVSMKGVESNAGGGMAKYFIPFNPIDLKLLILPDNKARKMAMANPEFKNFYESGDCEALIVSLEEIESM